MDGGGYFAPHDTNNSFWICIYVRSTRARAPTDGTRRASYFCLSHACTVFLLRRTLLQPSAQGRYGLWCSGG
jgi:hypothetical protein